MNISLKHSFKFISFHLSAKLEKKMVLSILFNKNNTNFVSSLFSQELDIYKFSNKKYRIGLNIKHETISTITGNIKANEYKFIEIVFHSIKHNSLTFFISLIRY